MKGLKQEKQNIAKEKKKKKEKRKEKRKKERKKKERKSRLTISNTKLLLITIYYYYCNYYYIAISNHKVSTIHQTSFLSICRCLWSAKAMATKYFSTTGWNPNFWVGFILFFYSRGVTVIVVENGPSVPSSNPGRSWLHFHIVLWE